MNGSLLVVQVKWASVCDSLVHLQVLLVVCYGDKRTRMSISFVSRLFRHTEYDIMECGVL